MAARVWDSVREDRRSTIVLVYQNLADIPIEAIGGKFRVDRIEGENLSAVAVSEKLQSRYADALKQMTIAAVVPDSQPLADSRILSLQKHPASLLFHVFLSKPELRDLAAQPEFLDIIHGLLLEIENLESILKAA